MTRQYCDRCGVDVTARKSGRMKVVEDADDDGNGLVTKDWDICGECTKALMKFMKGEKGK